MRAAAGSLVFLVVAPGTMGALVPWLITGWEARPVPPAPAAVGWLLVVAGVAVLLWSFARFVLEGRGTPAPVAPTERLVVGGAYRHVRNPMYVAVTAIIAGQALLLGRGELAWYAAGFWALTASFVRFYEEPTLARRYGDQYRAYRENVPGWVPRLRPWRSIIAPMEHPASRALRERSPRIWHEALVHDLVDGEAQWLRDERDLMVWLAPYHDCARRLGMDVAGAFEQAAAAGPSSLREVVGAFGKRRDVVPATFEVVLADGPDGPAYRLG